MVIPSATQHILPFPHIQILIKMINKQGFGHIRMLIKYLQNGVYWGNNNELR